jgi:hypothetical protein
VERIASDRSDIDAGGSVLSMIAAPGDNRTRKHPALAVNGDGDVLLAWTEGTSWARGGSAAWQVFGRDGSPKGPSGHADGVAAWSLVTAFARPDKGFTVVY